MHIVKLDEDVNLHRWVSDRLVGFCVAAFLVQVIVLDFSGFILSDTGGTAVTSSVLTTSQDVIIQLVQQPVSAYRVYLQENDRAETLLTYTQWITETHSRLLQKLEAIGVSFYVQREFLYAFNGLAATVPEDSIAVIAALPEVQSVHVDQEVHACLSESVPLIDADAVWQLHDSSGINATGAGITVAIVDTGVDYLHPDLGGGFGPEYRVVGGYDFVNNDVDPMDDHGHGTHCAGILAANGSLKGVAPDVQLFAYKVLDSTGVGRESDLIAAIDRALDPDHNISTDDAVDVISLSLGHEIVYPDDPISQAVNAAVESGVVVVVAAGNSGPASGTITSPGSAENAITVGAVDKNDTLWLASSRGPRTTIVGGFDPYQAPYESNEYKPDLVAPGVSINSTWPYGQYAVSTGTSMATPHVAGAVALLLQLHPSWTCDEVKAALLSSATELEYGIFDQGAGRVNVLNASSITFEHDLAVIDVHVPLNVVMAREYNVTAVIGNLKNSTETLVQVNYYVNYDRSASKTIPVLPGHSTVTVSFSWVPNETRNTVVQVEVEPLPQEQNVLNNEKTVVVGVSDSTILVSWDAAVASDIHSVVAVDLDTDGECDDVVIGTVNGGVYAFDSEGTFLWQATVPFSLDPRMTPPTDHLTAVDLDSDGVLDAVVVGGVAGVFVFRGNGSLLWSRSSPSNSLYTTVCAMDLDGDGIVDDVGAAFTHLATTPERSSSTILVCNQTGDEFWVYTVENMTSTHLSAVDLDRDGSLDDLIWTGSRTNTDASYPPSAFAFNQTGSVRWTYDLSVVSCLQVLDLNSDGYLDDAVLAGGDEPVIVAIDNAGALTWTQSLPVDPTVLQSVDMDGDSIKDDIVFDQGAAIDVLDQNGISLWRSSILGDVNGTRGHLPRGWVIAVTSLDADGDSIADEIVALSNLNELFVFLPNGTIGMSAGLGLLHYAGGPYSQTYTVTPLDLDSDGYYGDLIVGSQKCFGLSVNKTVVIDYVSVTDNRANVGSNQTISFHARSDPGGLDVINGTIYVNDHAYFTNATGWIQLNVSTATVGEETWEVTQVNVDDVFNYRLEVSNPTIIWDYVQVNLSIADSRIDVGQNATIIGSGSYAYDGSPLVGSIVLNDTQTQYDAIGRKGYTTVSIVDQAYGLTAYMTNSISCIWDRIQITHGSVTRPTANLTQRETIWFHAVYEYDGAPFNGTTGILYVNGSTTAWSAPNGRWEHHYASYTPGRMAFMISGIADTQYGLQTINDVSGPQSIAWIGFETIVDGMRYPIPLHTNSTISNFMFTPTRGQINLTITRPSPGAAVKISRITATWNGSDRGSGIQYYAVKLDDHPWIDCGLNTSYTFTRVPDGTHVLHVQAVDHVARFNDRSISFTVNTSLIGRPGWVDDIVITLGVSLLGIVSLLVFSRRQPAIP